MDKTILVLVYKKFELWFISFFKEKANLVQI